MRTRPHVLRILAISFAASCAAARSPDWVNRFPQLKAVPDYNSLVGATAGPPQTLGNLTKIEVGRRNVSLTAGVDVVRVEFWRGDVVRLWLGWKGTFEDPARGDIVVGEPDESLQVSTKDAGDYVDIGLAGDAGGVAVRVNKSPLRFSLLHGGSVLWAEQLGLTKNDTATFQTLSNADDEYFFGGGMQNGRFSHKGERIRISTDSNWADGGNPNAVPLYLSSAGYGVYRNTWAPGVYDFTGASSVIAAHNETRFDAFFFVAAPRDFKALLGAYTYLTGKPFMPPIYGLGMGDSDCYHNSRHGNNTHVVTAVADKYRELDIPGSWFLPNDGYGCGFGVGPSTFPSDFKVLDAVVAELKQRGFETGLWSSTGLPNISREVSGSGVRIGKTDVGWIGNGYKYAFDSVMQVVDGIEKNSDGRRFIWTVEGWAGTHRTAVMWTGDDTGSFEYIRWQIPTFVGTGFSAQAHVSGDVDGIFGGSPETYVRDLQFKCFMTVMMSMSGWAANPDKQPWTWGEPYTSINRMYLKLKARLTPYFYTLSRFAYDSGVPPVRALALEFPDDKWTFANHTGSAMQFMAGPSFLVAPVYKPLAETTVREGIYLPAGQWVDYWNGSIVTGPLAVNNYAVPLDKLPVFVKAGAIVPMWPEKYDPLRRVADELTLDVYPAGKTTFELYEDDGVTRAALEKDAFSKTLITCDAADDALEKGGKVRIDISATKGTFDGAPTHRAYVLQVHTQVVPKAVAVVANGHSQPWPLAPSLSSLDMGGSGWFYDKFASGGVVKIRLPAMPTASAFSVELSPAELSASSLPELEMVI
eukprot:TRINITY_DN90248_c0_g1_i1.p1 TRINITY_DN90248_c0_g1~~TRINITY_DN90248_c0_g1_i1.p1  ORF type:complete len:810 (-),score=176.41 TRINITY_DN90248_c0_g1_i1:293-2722(-)